MVDKEKIPAGSHRFFFLLFFIFPIYLDADGEYRSFGLLSESHRIPSVPDHKASKFKIFYLAAR
jgi:hypothetical protein